MSILPLDVPTPLSLPVRPARRAALAHIPGDEGWPIIGRTLDILADPKGEVDMAATYGLVYRTRVLGETGVSLLGPDANSFRLARSDQAVFLHSRLGHFA